jgi:hypothetical protein
MRLLTFFKRLTQWCVMALSIGGGTSCSLDYVNPNAAAENQVLTTREGIFALAIGMQQFYATQTLGSVVTIPGVTARELGTPTTFQNPLDLEIGGTLLPPEHGSIFTLWAQSFRTIGMAEKLINNTPNIGNISAGTRAGIIALGSLYKAMTLGHLAMYFEQVPTETGTPSNGAIFRSRADVLTEVNRLLDNAASQIASNPPGSEFTGSILARGFNLPNTIQAMRARFLNMAGRHSEAIAAANNVNTGATGVSTFVFDTQQNRNPVFVIMPLGGNYAPRDNFGTLGLNDSSDARLRFFMGRQERLSSTSLRLPLDSLVCPFFTRADASIPVFRMGEMALIRAEAYARQGNLTSAVTEINLIRTKTAASDPLGIGANLPPYSGSMNADAILTEIYAQRCAELFMTGMRMEDARRFGRPAPTPMPSALVERSRNYYPYPALERDNNRANTPPDPSI